MEHPCTLWNTLEKALEKRLTQKATSSSSVALKQTWAWIWIPQPQRRCECRPGSSRLIPIRLKASPFNITIIQTYAPTTDNNDDGIEDFCYRQEAIDQAPKKDIPVVQRSAGQLECKDTKGCKQELEGDMLQPWDQRKRLEAHRIRQLQQSEDGEHLCSTQTI